MLKLKLKLATQAERAVDHLCRWSRDQTSGGNNTQGLEIREEKVLPLMTDFSLLEWGRQTVGHVLQSFNVRNYKPVGRKRTHTLFAKRKAWSYVVCVV